MRARLHSRWNGRAFQPLVGLRDTYDNITAEMLAEAYRLRFDFGLDVLAKVIKALGMFIYALCELREIID